MPGGANAAQRADDGGFVFTNEGRCQPVGDTRKIVNGLGWIDYFADGRANGAVVEKLDL